jgi:hypothetical protein
MCDKSYRISWAPVALTCNPSYSGGRDQEDHSLKPENNSQNLIWKKNYKKGLVAHGVGPEFKHKYHRKERHRINRVDQVRLRSREWVGSFQCGMGWPG